MFLFMLSGAVLVFRAMSGIESELIGSSCLFLPSSVGDSDCPNPSS